MDVTAGYLPVLAHMTDRGFSITGADYPGGYDLTSSGRTATLTLHGVTLPTRVRLTLSRLEDYLYETHDFYDTTGRRFSSAAKGWSCW